MELTCWAEYCRKLCCCHVCCSNVSPKPSWCQAKAFLVEAEAACGRSLTHKHRTQGRTAYWGIQEQTDKHRQVKGQADRQGRMHTAHEIKRGVYSRHAYSKAPGFPCGACAHSTRDQEGRAIRHMHTAKRLACLVRGSSSSFKRSSLQLCLQGSSSVLRHLQSCVGCLCLFLYHRRIPICRSLSQR